MSLKVSKGNMYDWITHMHSHLAGECPHKCSYCYVQRNKFGVSDRYKGNIRLIKSEFDENYGNGKIIFIEHMNDLFADGIEENWIRYILEHCNKYPDNTYVFQSKNPMRAVNLLHLFPKNFMFGTTLETNRNMTNISKAPMPECRYSGISMIKKEGIDVFITIEPIMDFDYYFANWIIMLNPIFVNIGADSKGCGLSEPSREKILRLINILKENNIDIKKKTNLKRIFN